MSDKKPVIEWIPTEEENGHKWGRYKDDPFESCRECCYVRRRDKVSRPCKGRVKIDLRKEKP